MADHLSVTIPLSNIQKIQIYLNTAKRSLSAIQAETGADYIINGTLYNMETFKPNCHLRVDGRTICTPAYDVAGYAWNDGPDISIDTLPDPTQRNYIACTPLVLDGKPIANLTYDPGQGGKRGRTVIGIKEDRLALYCTRDGGTMTRTPETLRDDLAAAGWESAVMLDGGGSSQCYFKGDTIKATRVVHDLILVYLKGSDSTVKTYSVKKDGSTYLSENFKVKEFACNDGSDTVLISDELVDLLQKIRDHFGVAVTINSGYRTSAYNKKVGGATNSQHVKGTAADIVAKGIDPLTVAQYAEYLMPNSGGIGVYRTFTHVDVRANRSRWDNRSGSEVVVSGWPGYEEKTEMSEIDQAVQWVQDIGIMQGDANGDMMLNDQPTRRQIAIMLYRFAKMIGKA